MKELLCPQCPPPLQERCADTPPLCNPPVEPVPHVQLADDVDAGIITQDEANLILEHLNGDNHVKAIKMHKLNEQLK